MLIGLDHITINSLKCVSKLNNTYKKIFKFSNAKNNINKKKFLRDYKKTHFISFFNTKKEFPDLEFTHYQKKLRKTVEVLFYDKNKIYIKSSEKKKDKNLLKNIFGIENKIDSFFKKKIFFINYIKSNKFEYFLDDPGPVAIALIVTEIKSYHKKISKIYNLEITKIFEYKINRRKTKIFFFRLPGGLIFEIIEYI